MGLCNKSNKNKIGIKVLLQKNEVFYNFICGSEEYDIVFKIIISNLLMRKSYYGLNLFLCHLFNPELKFCLIAIP